MKKFFEFSNQIDLSYLALDWDDNILYMPTKIHMDHLVDGELIPTSVSTVRYAKIRNNPDWKTNPNSYCEFRDWGPRGENAFLEDAIEAIKKEDFGPSWHKFLEYLSKGTIFAIITARGHEPRSMRVAIEWIIDNVLSDEQQNSLYSHCLKFSYLFGEDYDKYERVPKGPLSKTELIKDYLDNCDFYGVSSDSFIQKFGLGDTRNPEIGKELALKEFSEKINEYGKKLGAHKVSLGFSDDDIKNVQHVTNLFKNELSLRYPMKYFVFDTSGGKKSKIQINEVQSSFGSGASTWGTDSSVLPFTKWNNLTQRLFNDSGMPKDDYHNQFRNQIGQLNDLTKDIKKKT